MDNLFKLIHGDCLAEMRAMPDNCVDLVLGSSPYEDARTYGVDFKLRGQAFVDWAVERYIECVRISRGLVAWVIEGKTRKFQYSAIPALMMADLHRAGIKLRKPPIFHRVGIPGSGGPDFLRSDYEFIVCASKGKLPWSDNTAMGKPTKYDEGGACTNRKANGERLGYVTPDQAALVGRHRAERQAGRKYAKPRNGLANPGNSIEQTYTATQVIELLAESTNRIHCKVGGGHMGSKIANENEAPFPEALAEFDVICGGFPCQDISSANHKGKGLDGERSGLWFEYLRIIREMQPKIVVIENVSALLVRGMGTVLCGLARCGFDAEWQTIPASPFGSPQQRNRIVIVAYRPCKRLKKTPFFSRKHFEAIGEKQTLRVRDWPGVAKCGGAHGTRVRWVPNGDFFRMADGVPDRLDRYRACGNAFIPQCAQWLGNRIVEVLSDAS